MANTENLGSKKMEQTTENENFVTKVLSFFNKYTVSTAHVSGMAPGPGQRPANKTPFLPSWKTDANLTARQVLLWLPSGLSAGKKTYIHSVREEGVAAALDGEVRHGPSKEATLSWCQKKDR